MIILLFLWVSSYQYNLCNNVRTFTHTHTHTHTHAHICLPSGKLSKLDEPGTQDTAGGAGTSSYVMYSYGPPHMAELKQDD